MATTTSTAPWLFAASPPPKSWNTPPPVSQSPAKDDELNDPCYAFGSSSKHARMDAQQQAQPRKRQRCQGPPWSPSVSTVSTSSSSSSSSMISSPIRTRDPKIPPPSPFWQPRGTSRNFTKRNNNNNRNCNRPCHCSCCNKTYSGNPDASKRVECRRPKEGSLLQYFQPKPNSSSTAARLRCAAPNSAPNSKQQQQHSKITNDESFRDCTYCIKPVCSACTVTCEACRRRICTICSTTEYDDQRRFPQTLCVDCCGNNTTIHNESDADHAMDLS